MSNSAIRKALEAKLATVLPAMPIAYENFNFAPTDGVPYAISNILFARPVTTGYGNAPYVQRGYMQVSLQYPTGKGAGQAEARGELLRSTFYRGLSLAANGVTTVIDETPEVTGGAIEGDSYVVKVLIRFYADIQNGV